MIVDRKRLMRALKLVGSVIEKRNTIPILSHVAIDGGRLTGTDLDVELSMLLPDMAKSKLSIAMAAPDKVYAILKASTADDATIEEEGGKLAVSSGDVSAKVFTLPHGDFPHASPVASDWKCEVGTEFMSALARVRIAVSTEETRYYLNGIYLHHVADWTYRMVATDGHRLAYADVEMPGAILGEDANQHSGIIIPRKALTALLGIHKAYRDAPICLRMGATGEGNEKKMPLATAHTTTRIAALIPTDDGEINFTSKLIDGTFPDYSRVIPTNEAKHVAVMDVADMRRALGGIIGCQSERTKAVKLNFVKRGLIISMKGVENIGDVSIKVDAEGTGGEFEVGFNARYLMDVLTMTAGATIRVEADDSSSPSRWYDPDSTNFRTVLMPMRV